MAIKFPPAGTTVGCTATNRILYAEHAMYDAAGKAYDPEHAPVDAVPHPQAPRETATHETARPGDGSPDARGRVGIDPPVTGVTAMPPIDIPAGGKTEKKDD